MRIWKCDKCCRNERTKDNKIMVICPECLEATRLIFQGKDMIIGGSVK